MELKTVEDRVRAFWGDFGNTIRATQIRVLKSRNANSQIRGNDVHFIFMDELSRSRPALDAEFSYESKLFPLATVSIYQQQGDKYDPRNPNPKAGKRRSYIIKIGDRRVGGEYASLAIAKNFAKPMHERLVKALNAEMEKNNPNFGRF